MLDYGGTDPLTFQEELRASESQELADARIFAHKAVQLISLAARANLPVESDDSHTSMTWDERRGELKSQPIARDGVIFAIRFSFHTAQLSVTRNGRNVNALSLNKISFKNAGIWLNDILQECQLTPVKDTSISYELPKKVRDFDLFTVNEDSEALKALGNWYDFANSALTDFLATQTNHSPGPSPIRCWPHHFDIATLVRLEDGNPKTARAIGVGMSPGDQYYDEPYFYVNPWPHISLKTKFPLLAVGHWHVDDFVGAIATSENLRAEPNLEKALSHFLQEAFAEGLKLLTR